MTLDDLIECMGCHTWQHTKYNPYCPKCGRRFPTERDLIEAKKARTNELRRKSAQEQADKSKERSKGLTMLCISKYEIDGELPPASVMSRCLYLETGTLISSTTMISWLKKLGWVRMKRGWKKEE